MKVFVAEEAGFCFGVKRALKLIEGLHRQGQKIQTLGPLIHNNYVLDDLKKKEIFPIDSLDGYTTDKTLIVRTHGVPRQIESAMKRRGIKYLDATCPLVKKAHHCIKNLAAAKTQTVIIGDRDHPEIIASQSYAKHAIIINSIEEARRIPFQKRLSVVAQTTLDTNFFKVIIGALVDRAETLEIFNTICAATSVRQEAVRKLAPKVDMLIVVGGRASSNTCKLAAIARSLNRHTFHIQSAAELRKPSLQRRLLAAKSVGITAGASTPPDEIDRVKAALNKYAKEYGSKEN